MHATAAASAAAAGDVSWQWQLPLFSSPSAARAGRRPHGGEGKWGRRACAHFSSLFSPRLSSAHSALSAPMHDHPSRPLGSVSDTLSVKRSHDTALDACQRSMRQCMRQQQHLQQQQATSAGSGSSLSSPLPAQRGQAEGRTGERGSGGGEHARTFPLSFLLASAVACDCWQCCCCCCCCCCVAACRPK